MREEIISDRSLYKFVTEIDHMQKIGFKEIVRLY